MDSRIAWIQPEQFGPATALWQRLWENSQTDEKDQRDAADNGNLIDAQGNNTTGGGAKRPTVGVPMVGGGEYAPTHYSVQAFHKMKLEKAERLRQEGIGELSPLSAGDDARLENAACTAGLPYAQLVAKQNARWRTRSAYPTGVHGLHHEIIDFYRWMSSTPEEQGSETKGVMKSIIIPSLV